MKVNCSACGAKNDKSISECQYCGATLIVASRKTSNNSSSSILNRGIALYKKGNYYKAEEVFLEVLENNKNDLIASMYLSFILNQEDFSNLKKDITTILQSTNDNDIKNTIYQSVLKRYETLFQPKIERIGLNKFEIEFDYIDFQLTEDFPGFLSELKALSALIMSFPQNYHQQFLKILIKRYQSPWTETYHFGRPLDELVFINDLDLLLKNNMEETKLLYSTISDLHVECIKRFLEDVKREDENYKFYPDLYRKGIIKWNERINIFFESCTFTESELGFSHSAKIEPYLSDLNKILLSNSKKSNATLDIPGCFIATAAMGDYNHPIVLDLRLFRDEWLLKRNWGIAFTKWYYTHGPKAANLIEKSNILKAITFLFIVKPLQKITQLVK